MPRQLPGGTRLLRRLAARLPALLAQDPDGDGTYTFEPRPSRRQLRSKSHHQRKLGRELRAGWRARRSRTSPLPYPPTARWCSFSYNPTTHILTIQPATATTITSSTTASGHNSQDIIYRQPFGAVNPNTPITLRFRTFHNDVTGVRVRFYDTATSSESFQDMQIVAADISCYDPALGNDTCDLLPDHHHPDPAHHPVLSLRGHRRHRHRLLRRRQLQGRRLGRPHAQPGRQQLCHHCFDPAFQPISWMQNAVIYQIFPDRFRNGRSNNDPTGNEPRYGYPSNPLDQIITKLWTALPEGYCRDYINPGTPCTEGPAAATTSAATSRASTSSSTTSSRWASPSST